MRNRKIKYYLGSLIKLAAANPVRMALTAAGIFISVLLFSLGMILSTSYYRGIMRIASLRVDKSVVIEIDTTSSDIARDIKRIAGTELTAVSELRSRRNLCSIRFEDGTFFNLNATVVGMYPSSSFIPVIDDNDNFIPVEVNLLSGRLISASDIRDRARVAVIDQYTAEVLFPSINPIDQVIRLNMGQNGVDIGRSDGVRTVEELRVVGVIEPMQIQHEHVNTVKQQMRFPEGNISLDTFVYCPLTTFARFSDYSAMEVASVKWVGCTDDDVSYEKLVSGAEQIQPVYEMKNQPFSVETKEGFIERIEQGQRHTKSLLGVGMAILCIISGLSIMSIAFFSVKERVTEIGIRKAFGATGTDIALQIILEMMVLSLLVSVISVCISFFVSKGIELYLTRELLLVFTLSISAKEMLLPVLVGCLTTFLCSLFPAIYAARLHVTDALRFE